ncbi:dolichol-p-glucose synthetase [Vibrio ishigakensis]|uniref:Dolichol-p-glucose synthetase n=1 Tax=Vibrio ishigakensis TaxID=1481914 RepID=A0A0B8QD23_9VIBR|nr:dolichol-p-glucose synthetase [Vibrio ishigakensis]
MSNASLELTILMPCLNEEETLETCIRKAQNFLKKENISGEVLISDNGSTDKSKDIALENGARVIEVEEKGYGSALSAGIKSSQGKFVIMGDADDSYNFSNLEPL